MSNTVNSGNIEIFTDGACSGNPGLGGWGAILRSGTHEKEIWGGEPDTTNNRMEMLAVIRALESLRSTKPVIIYTDSQYVQKGMTEWLSGWKRRNWKTSTNTAVKNVDLWQCLDQLAGEHQLDWRWVRGHDGHIENERADALARRGVSKVRELGQAFADAGEAI